MRQCRVCAVRIHRVQSGVRNQVFVNNYMYISISDSLSSRGGGWCRRDCPQNKVEFWGWDFRCVWDWDCVGAYVRSQISGGCSKNHVALGQHQVSESEVGNLGILIDTYAPRFLGIPALLVWEGGACCHAHVSVAKQDGKSSTSTSGPCTVSSTQTKLQWSKIFLYESLALTPKMYRMR